MPFSAIQIHACSQILRLLGSINWKISYECVNWATSMGAPSSRTLEISLLDEGPSRKILKLGNIDGGVGKCGERVTGSVSYTHLTLPTILRV